MADLVTRIKARRQIMREGILTLAAVVAAMLNGDGEKKMREIINAE